MEDNLKYRFSLSSTAIGAQVETPKTVRAWLPVTPRKPPARPHHPGHVDAVWMLTPTHPMLYVLPFHGLGQFCFGGELNDKTLGAP